MAAKKTYTGGAADRKRRGLKGVVVAVPPETHRAMAVAAAVAGQSLAAWSASQLEAAARAALADAKMPWPSGEKKS